ncbi:SDR family NAD(P)-dependent oxidoreductase [Flammeovirga sp. MY04]|uniref:SDR family NAD(P)-dependent oxidoreductase n=1 Tax=Flammeovirga sp. MY04 TaxID=1191459 RepID=UPI0008060B85|nr:SDR family NAD(P)-dependent oxidoreductase [Flammeovirga sp. MY04]ANQ52356.1 SDR family NAD(P)-dependent oxidoreductase [Flammeovirga sp. MY04]
MNKTILITGANAGIGKETARQLAMKKETEKIYLACRNLSKAEAAKKELEAATGKDFFEIVIMDVSDPYSVQHAVKTITQPVDALIMNAGGTGGKTPEKLTKDGVTILTASNLLGHVALVDELIKANKLKNVALFASSEAARGIKKMGMLRPELETSSREEFISVFDGSKFKDNFDAFQIYGWIKYGGTLWMSSMANKYPDIKFLSVSPGGTRGTQGMDDLSFIKKIFIKHIGMKFIMPLMGMSHSLESGAKRFVDAIGNPQLKSGKFYASKKNVLTGPIVDQSAIWKDFDNHLYQKNADEAIHTFLAS